MGIHQCGVNGCMHELSSSCLVVVQGPLLSGAVNVRWGFVPIYTCTWREADSLITHTSIISPMVAWDSPVVGRGIRTCYQDMWIDDMYLSCNAFRRGGCF